MIKLTLIISTYLLIGIIIAKVDSNTIKVKKEELKKMNVDTGEPTARFIFIMLLWPINIIANIMNNVKNFKQGFTQNLKKKFKIEYEKGINKRKIKRK